jgi:cyclase
MDRVRLLNRLDVDELIILDISATPNNRGPRFDEVERLCENLFMPVTIGGGIRSIADIRRLLACGADKVAVGTMAVREPDFVSEAAERFGSQAVVVSIDVRKGHVVCRCGQDDTAYAPAEWASNIEDRGAGEILLTSIEYDGMMEGYDLPLISAVSKAVDIPVIAAGGCGSYGDMAEAFRAGAHAVAVGAMFQFADVTPRGAARYLSEQGIPVRL